VAGFCEHSNELLGSITGREFRDQLSDHQIFKELVHEKLTSLHVVAVALCTTIATRSSCNKHEAIHRTET